MNYTKFLASLSVANEPLIFDVRGEEFPLIGIRVESSFPTERGELGGVETEVFLQIGRSKDVVNAAKLHKQLEGMSEEAEIFVELYGQELTIRKINTNRIECTYNE